MVIMAAGSMLLEDRSTYLSERVSLGYLLKISIFDELNIGNCGDSTLL